MRNALKDICATWDWMMNGRLEFCVYYAIILGVPVPYRFEVLRLDDGFRAAVFLGALWITLALSFLTARKAGLL